MEQSSPQTDQVPSVDLTQQLEKLIRLLEADRNRPRFRDVRIVEINAQTVLLDDGKYRIREKELILPSQYKGRFDEVLHMGYPWINLSCYGIHKNFLVVAIEVPRSAVAKVGHPRSASVNLSGPARVVRENGWAVDPVLVVVE